MPKYESKLTPTLNIIETSTVFFMPIENFEKLKQRSLSKTLEKSPSFHIYRVCLQYKKFHLDYL